MENKQSINMEVQSANTSTKAVNRKEEYYSPVKFLLVISCFLFGNLVSFGYCIVTISA